MGVKDVIGGILWIGGAFVILIGIANLVTYMWARGNPNTAPGTGKLNLKLAGIFIGAGLAMELLVGVLSELEILVDS